MPRLRTIEVIAVRKVGRVSNCDTRGRGVDKLLERAQNWRKNITTGSN